MIGHHRDPQKAHPWPKPHLHGDFGDDRSSGATWARDEGTKKGAVFPLTLTSGLYNSLYNVQAVITHTYRQTDRQTDRQTECCLARYVTKVVECLDARRVVLKRFTVELAGFLKVSVIIHHVTFVYQC